MAIFFFLVGLEIKREVIEGRLSNIRQAGLPVIAAIGEMLVPALIYVALNADDSAALNGWAIPAATDIAFALGILALFGTGAPVALKVFLLALAIIDDLGTIVIIAIFYTSELSPGVHATLAGVVIALFIPLRAGAEDGKSPLVTIEHGLAPWVTFGVTPIFAFANAGVSLQGLTLSDLFAGIPLGIVAGLFIGTLAFADPEHASAVRIGVLTGSFLSAVVGAFVLRIAIGTNSTQAAPATRSA